MNIPTAFTRRFLAVALVFAVLITAPIAATIGLYWQKSDVIPVIMVRPIMSGFVPVDGSPIGNTWSKDQVTPMCLVRPLLGGFVPADGSAIGNTWSKDEVKPFIEVQPSIGGFTPRESSNPVASSRMEIGEPEVPAIS